MCSICGGSVFNEISFNIFNLAKERGKDYSNLFYRKNSWICNHRAVPTTEIEEAEFNQPFGSSYKIVHNGTISNDKELGNTEGMIDSYILSKVLDFSDIHSFTKSLEKIKGSYSIAVLKPSGSFYLACNYKPLFFSYDNEGNFYFSSYENHLIEAGLSFVKRLPPYSTLDTETGETETIPREVFDRALVICSGGLDSTAVAAYAKTLHKEITLLHYKYGCKAETKEMQAIKNIAKDLNCDYVFLPIDYTFSSSSSTLLNDDSIQTGIKGAEYAYEWVPSRNLVMLSLATAYAEANHYSYIYLGTNLEESGAYPDNEEQFIKDFNSCLYGAVQNGAYVEIRTPLGNMMKHEIVKFGNKYNAPFNHTWSCYKNGEKPCGQCGPCFMRRTAFKRNGLVDPLEYPSFIENDEVL